MWLCIGGDSVGGLGGGAEGGGNGGNNGGGGFGNCGSGTVGCDGDAIFSVHVGICVYVTSSGRGRSAHGSHLIVGYPVFLSDGYTCVVIGVVLGKGAVVQGLYQSSSVDEWHPASRGLLPTYSALLLPAGKKEDQPHFTRVTVIPKVT